MKLFRRQEAFRILVIAAMMASLASAAGEVASRLLPGFDPTLLVVLSFLVCLEGIATDRLARQLPEASARLRLRLVEWVVIVLLLRLVLSLSHGPDALALAVARWLEQPQSLLDAGLVTAGILLFAVWGLGLRMSQSLEALGPEADAPPPKDSAAYYAWLTRPRADQRAEGWQNLVQLFLGGGVLLLFCSGMARLDVGAALSLRNPAIAGIVGNALLYFVLGFTVLAQGHYAMLRSRWERHEVEVSQRLPRRWAVLALGFTASVAMLALLLPARPSLALFGAVFDALWTAFYYLAGAVLTVYALLAYLLALLTRLLGREPARQAAGPRFDLPPARPQPVAQRVAWWEAIQGFVLWAIILAALVYAVLRFVRERSGLWKELASRRGPVGWIVGLLAALWRWLARTGGQVGARWRALLSRSGAAGAMGEGRSRLGWFRPHTAREQVRLLYLVALEQMARYGWTRGSPDTPYEYAQRVAPRVPEGKGELDALTQAFVAARYSRRQFAPAEVGPLRVALRRLRQACRRIVSRGPSPAAARDVEGTQGEEP